MFIDLSIRGITDDVTSTAQSFKSWDTCMANKPCKIIAIVGIVLACLFALWMISTFVRCCCMGVACLEALCCCCCRPARTQKYQEPHPYENHNMYPTTKAPVYQAPPQAYFGNQGYQPVSTGYNNQGYQPVNTSYEGYVRDEKENPFEERQYAR